MYLSYARWEQVKIFDKPGCLCRQKSDKKTVFFPLTLLLFCITFAPAEVFVALKSDD